LRRSDGREYALKKVKLPQLSEKEKDNALNEVRLLASINTEYIIGYKEAFWDEQDSCLCIIMEIADGGDLYQKIVEREQNKTYFPEADVWRVLIGLCLGLRALHGNHPPILHRDLKSANVFLTRRGDPKLGDLNVSKVAKRGMLHTQTGTPYYASPEVWKDCPYDAASDIWGLGCVIYEMCALRPPFRAEDMESLYRKVLRGSYPRIPSCFSQDLRQVIAMMLQKRPSKRPTVDQLLMAEVVQRHMHLALNEGGADAAGGGMLLSTIKLPEDCDLSSYLPGALPKARYDDRGTPRESSSCGDAAGGGISSEEDDSKRWSPRQELQQKPSKVAEQ
jgi:NIMA (never in mitosis gene a)-related kinase